MTVATWWAPHALLPSGWADGVVLTAQGDRFTDVTVGVTSPPPGSVALSGAVVPGFANAHSHAFHRALRGRTHGDGGTFWTWRDVMYQVADHLTPENYYQLARAVYAEMACAGMTAVGEFHYVHHQPDGRRYADPNAMGYALQAAAKDAGVRITLLDTCYLASGVDQSGYLPPNQHQVRFSDGTATAWAERVQALHAASHCTDSFAPGSMAVGAAIHSARAVPADQLGTVATALPDAPLHIHLSEQPAENEMITAAHGCSPTGLLGRHGALSDRLTAVHATHLSAADIAALGQARTGACFCPTTERDLADGIGPARSLAAAGVTLSLGSDQHAVVDMFEEARGIEMHERLSSGQRGRFSPNELWTMATISGHRALGWETAGQLASGAPADFVVIDTASVRTAGSHVDQLVYSATASDVTDVVCGAEWTVRDRTHRSVDPSSELYSWLRNLHNK